MAQLFGRDLTCGYSIRETLDRTWLGRLAYFPNLPEIELEDLPTLKHSHVFCALCQSWSDVHAIGGTSQQYKLCITTLTPGPHEARPVGRSEKVLLWN